MLSFQWICFDNMYTFKCISLQNNYLKLPIVDYISKELINSFIKSSYGALNQSFDREKITMYERFLKHRNHFLSSLSSVCLSDWGRKVESVVLWNAKSSLFSQQTTHQNMSKFSSGNLWVTKKTLMEWHL